MADTGFRFPRRKKGAKSHPKDAPFPVPIQSITSKEPCSERWYYYTGHFRDNCVVIEDLGDLTFLYRMGFFGKGFLSRSKPEYEVISNISQKAFSKSEKLRRLPPKEREIRQSKFRVVKKERFKNHKQWWEQINGAILTDDPLKLECEEAEEAVDTCIECPQHHQEFTVDSENIESLPNEEDGSPSPKRIKMDIFCGEVSELHHDHQDGSRTEEISVNSSDDEDITKSNSGEDTDADVTNRELEEVVHDVMRKSNQKKSEKVNEDTKQTQIKSKGKKQEDPYKVFEHLQLSLEEAFFLSYGLGCLSVLNSNKKPMSLSEMWCSFCTAKRNFLPSYITYHYFRSKGWVPKIGIKYATDFVLYKEGMPFYHSSYSVIVQMVDSQSLEVDKNSSPCRQLSWPQLCGVSRVSGHAAKEVMICYVIKPSDMTKEEMMSPNCIPRFKLQEVVLRRWIPKRAREPDKDRT